MLVMLFAVNYAKAAEISAIREIDPSTPMTNYISLGEWNTDGDFDGWAINHSYDSNDVAALAVYGGSITGRVAGNDLWIRKNESFNLVSGSVVEIRCKYDPNTANTSGKYYFYIGGWQNLPFIIGSEQPVDGNFHIYRTTLTENAGQTILIRVDQLSGDATIGETFEVDYVRVSKEKKVFKVDSTPLFNFTSVAEWNTDDDFEDWTFRNIVSSNVAGGILSGTPSTADPYFYKDSASGLPIVNLDNAQIVEFRLKQDASFTSDMQIFFGTENNPGMSGSRVVTIPGTVIPTDGNFHLYQYDMSTHPDWNGTLETLRIDPYNGASAVGKTFEIDYIRVGSYDIPVVTPTASYGTYSDKVVLNWDAAAYGTKYQLWRCLSNDSSIATSVDSNITTNYFDDTTVALNTYYYYWLKVWGTNKWGDFGGSDVGFATLSTGPDKPINISPAEGVMITSFPVILEASAYSDEYSWPMIAAQWQIDNDTNFSYANWDSGTLDTTLTTIEPPSSVFGLTNYWRVRYQNDLKKWSEWSLPTLFNFNYNRNTNAADLFFDTFNVTDSGNVNKDYYIAGRQFGSDAPINYTILRETEIGMSSSNPGQLTLGLNSGCSVNKSFTDSGNFKIEFDVIPHNLDKTNDWVALSFGKSNQSSLYPVSPSGAGLVFFGNTAFQAFDGETMVGSGGDVASGKKLHIVLTAGTESFDNDPVQYSAFANGIPMRVKNDTITGYVYNDDGGFDNNYIALYNYNKYSVNKSVFDNLEISKVENTVTVTNWLSDSDMLPMNPAKTTHAVNLNGESITINGVDFTGTGTNFGSYANGSAILQSNGWELMSSGGIVTFHNNQDVSNIVSDIGTKTLMEYFVYFNKGAGIKLSGLNPYSTNVISLYSYGWEEPGAGRFAYLSSTSGGTITNIDQDTFGNGSGIIIRYDYLADKNGEFTLVVSPAGIASFHISGFSSEEVYAPPATINVADEIDFGEVVVGVPTSLQLEIMNIGLGIVSGSVTGISAPFTMTDSYLATAATSDIINVTFNPSGEEIYSRTITLSGSGGSAQVLLTGTGVPEPYLFIIYHLLFVIYYFRKK